jgi:cbb3-type cytochrome oxidase subunit 1
MSINTMLWVAAWVCLIALVSIGYVLPKLWGRHSLPTYDRPPKRNPLL